VKGFYMSAVAGTERRPVRMEAPEDRGFVLPPANISATDSEYLLELEMPGVDKDGLDVTLEGNNLIVTGRRKKDIPEGELLYSESPQADYRRVFEFGTDVDASKITAEMDQGVLKLHLPKSEKAKPRKIPVAD
jgi:HSP20 family protein